MKGKKEKPVRLNPLEPTQAHKQNTARLSIKGGWTAIHDKTYQPRDIIIWQLCWCDHGNDTHNI